VWVSYNSFPLRNRSRDRFFLTFRDKARNNPGGMIPNVAASAVEDAQDHLFAPDTATQRPSTMPAPMTRLSATTVPSASTWNCTVPGPPGSSTFTSAPQPAPAQ
jgi:hypothetical protein